MKNLIILALVGVFLTGCGTPSQLKGLPEAELLEAAMDSQRLESEMALKMQICGDIQSLGLESNDEIREYGREIRRAYDYYEEQTQPFNRKVRRYLRDYEDQYRVDFGEQMTEANFQLNMLAARLETAQYFGVANKQVKDALVERNSHFSYGKNPNSIIIVQALHEQNKNIMAACKKLITDVFDDKIQPNFSKYAKEYKQMTGMNGLSTQK